MFNQYTNHDQNSYIGSLSNNSGRAPPTTNFDLYTREDESIDHRTPHQSGIPRTISAGIQSYEYEQKSPPHPTRSYDGAMGARTFVLTEQTEQLHSRLTSSPPPVPPHQLGRGGTDLIDEEESGRKGRGEKYLFLL